MPERRPPMTTMPSPADCEINAVGNHLWVDCRACPERLPVAKAATVEEIIEVLIEHGQAEHPDLQWEPPRW